MEIKEAKKAEAEASEIRNAEKMSVEFDFLRQQAQALENQLNNLSQRKAELQIIHDSIVEIKGHQGRKILIPIGSGLFLKGKLETGAEMLVNVGANILLNKPVEEAQKIIDNQLSQLSEDETNMRNELIGFIQRMRDIQSRLIALSQREKAGEYKEVKR